jgi:uncharacterized membrane protein YcaP (DUF421 family)
MKKHFTFKAISVCLIAALFAIATVPRVEAGFVPSSETAQGSRVGDMAKIQKALEMKIVAETLHKMGYTKEEVQSRLDGMTDRQLHDFASRIDDARAAGDGLEVVLIAVLIIVIVVLVLKLTGHRIIVR